MDEVSGRVLVEVDPRYFRPAEVDLLLGNPAKAHTKLGWRHTTTFLQLVEEMVKSDLVLLQQGHIRDGHNYGRANVQAAE